MLLVPLQARLYKLVAMLKGMGEEKYAPLVALAPLIQQVPTRFQGARPLKQW